MESYEAENVLCYEGGISENLVLTESKKSPETLEAMEGVRGNL